MTNIDTYNPQTQSYLNKQQNTILFQSLYITKTNNKAHPSFRRSTLGKTCGRGHKGQKARSGGFTKIDAEGAFDHLQNRF